MGPSGRAGGVPAEPEVTDMVDHDLPTDLSVPGEGRLRGAGGEVDKCIADWDGLSPSAIFIQLQE